MTDDWGDKVATALRQGLEFEGEILGRGLEIREQSKRVYGSPLLDARLSLVAIWASLVHAYNGKRSLATDGVSDRLTLLAAFIQGVGATESLVSEGQYVKATAALKQDMEILVRIHETEAGVAKPGKTPQMKYLPAVGARPIYGELNKVAHPSNIDLLQTLLGSANPSPGTHGVSLTPVFVSGTAEALYELHIFLLFEMTRHLIRLFMEMYAHEDEEIQLAAVMWRNTGSLLEQAGHLQEEH
jgi:hypothetical protein